MSCSDEPHEETEPQPQDVDLLRSQIQSQIKELESLISRFATYNTSFHQHEQMVDWAKRYGFEKIFSLEVWEIQDFYEAFILSEKTSGNSRVGRGSTPEEAIKAWLEWNDQ